MAAVPRLVPQRRRSDHGTRRLIQARSALERDLGWNEPLADASDRTVENTLYQLRHTPHVRLPPTLAMITPSRSAAAVLETVDSALATPPRRRHSRHGGMIAALATPLRHAAAAAHRQKHGSGSGGSSGGSTDPGVEARAAATLYPTPQGPPATPGRTPGTALRVDDADVCYEAVVIGVSATQDAAESHRGGKWLGAGAPPRRRRMLCGLWTRKSAVRLQITSRDVREWRLPDATIEAGSGAARLLSYLPIHYALFTVQESRPGGRCRFVIADARSRQPSGASLASPASGIAAPRGAETSAPRIYEVADRPAMAQIYDQLQQARAQILIRGLRPETLRLAVPPVASPIAPMAEAVSPQDEGARVHHARRRRSSPPLSSAAFSEDADADQADDDDPPPAGEAPDACERAGACERGREGRRDRAMDAGIATASRRTAAPAAADPGYDPRLTPDAEASSEADGGPAVKAATAHHGVIIPLVALPGPPGPPAGPRGRQPLTPPAEVAPAAEATWPRAEPRSEQRPFRADAAVVGPSRAETTPLRGRLAASASSGHTPATTATTPTDAPALRRVATPPVATGAATTALAWPATTRVLAETQGALQQTRAALAQVRAHVVDSLERLDHMRLETAALRDRVPSAAAAATAAGNGFDAVTARALAQCQATVQSSAVAAAAAMAAATPRATEDRSAAPTTTASSPASVIRRRTRHDGVPPKPAAPVAGSRIAASTARAHVADGPGVLPADPTGHSLEDIL
ncbi:hypothetical protein CXG81DRAFT_24668 [Caulochytrium protostelioides]|uniref:Uncharacterized protein n=1 Tax=Caulochytrium protostelioides TaxID=1555241 RepID=A0A4P9XBE9_9FUNG|nr:hypothetical protein CXG81DRAFT_24668 [Caulochytrium protostelioides]|eukprot:RKP02702.1 hypothetical protein CXG81DRAFT_24668 [Caulochytrium protostelioides]